MIPNEIQTLEIDLTDDEKKMITAFEKEISKPIVKPTPASSAPARKTSLKKESSISDADKKAAGEQKTSEELVKENDETEEERNRLSVPKAKREFRVITDEERPQDLRTN